MSNDEMIADWLKTNKPQKLSATRKSKLKKKLEVKQEAIEAKRKEVKEEKYDDFSCPNHGIVDSIYKKQPKKKTRKTK